MGSELQDIIKEDIREHGYSFDELNKKYGDQVNDSWALRKLLAEYRRERALQDVEVRIEPTIRKSVSTFGLPGPTAVALDEGFFRPIHIDIPKLTLPKPVFHRAGYQALILSDLHAPEHDPHAVDVVLQIGQAVGVDRVIIAGDLYDVHALSRYTTASHRPVRWVEERQEAVKEAVRIRANFPDIPIDFIPGNHDLRVQKWIDANAVPLQGLFSLEYLLGIEDLNFNVVDRLVLADGRLLIKHGTKVSKNAGESVKKEILEAGMSVISGHCHRLSRIHVFHAAQEIQEAQPLLGVELGCLAKLHPDYQEKEDTANWQHGAAILSIADDGFFNVELISIHNGRSLFRGMQFISRVNQ